MQVHEGDLKFTFLSPSSVAAWSQAPAHYHSLGSALMPGSWGEAWDARLAKPQELKLCHPRSCAGGQLKCWGTKAFPATSPLFPVPSSQVSDTSQCQGRRKRNLEDRSPCGSFHRLASMIYQLTGNEKKTSLQLKTWFCSNRKQYHAPMYSWERKAAPVTDVEHS